MRCCEKCIHDKAHKTFIGEEDEIFSTCIVLKTDTTFDHTIKLMRSTDYKDRFRAEYMQTKIRYEKLKAFNTRIEAAERTMYEKAKVDEPEHDCPADMLREQQSVMGEYLHILELRAVIEGIDL